MAIDVETTGVNADTSRVIEIGAVKMNHRGEVLDTFSSLLNPGYDVPLNPQAQRVHGITPQMVWSAPPTEEVLTRLAAFIGGYGVVAHNLAFENRFLTAEYERIDRPAPAWQGICTLAAARAHLIAPNHKLGTLLDLLDLPAINNHRAEADAHACGLLLAAMIERSGVSDLVPVGETVAPTTAQRTHHETMPVAAGEPPVVDQAATRAAMGGFDPTDEQACIIDSFNTGSDLVICALAGTGKTSTLRGIARLEATRRPHRHGLYIAFNRSVADEAKSQFPDQVQTSTAHALALRNLRNTPHGPLLAKLDGGRATFRDIAAAIDSHKIFFTPGGDGPSVLAQYPVTRLALATVEKFCTTMDEHIGPHHVPEQKGIDQWSPQRSELVDHVLPIARRAWAAIRDPHNWTIKFTPSHMLKLWADTHPIVGRDGDYLMLDEAQDANPLIASIVNDQTHMQRIRVGDQNQSIYCQPVGTMVEVPTVDEVPPHRLCGVAGCGRAKAHRASGYCDSHEQQRRQGTELSLPDRRRAIVQTARVPIESLKAGDRVCTYNNANVYMNGRRVVASTRFHYEGQLVRVRTTSGLESRYTTKHHCVVRFAGNEGKHVVYLMKRGTQFRVGRVPLFYKTQSNSFGLRLRLTAEGADAAWILTVHDTAAGASLNEALIQHKFNLPGVCFNDHAHKMDVEVFWSKVGDTAAAGERCLREHGRLLEYPLIAGPRSC
ncbi:exonuclease domain-containing protein [Prescottella subtropica]|uniref:exonuclease domain-containing protein n=1 Tax=Prescottella subtropica TaxID=2545757 RepID=UPI001387141A|nr:exonuclease domain-containing protein [Prescottella subtropica]